MFLDLPERAPPRVSLAVLVTMIGFVIAAVLFLPGSRIEKQSLELPLWGIATLDNKVIDGMSNTTSFRTVRYGEHTYIVLDPAGTYRSPSFQHDPECKCGWLKRPE